MSAPAPSKLDFPQVLQGAYDDNTGSLRTSATAIISPTGSVNILIASSADSVSLGSSDGSLTATFTTVSGKTGLDTNIINLPPVQAVSGSALTASVDLTAQYFSSTSTISRVSANNSNVTLLSANLARKGAVFFNEGGAATAYLKLGSSASVTSYTLQIYPNSNFILDSNPIFTGRIDCIWTGTTASAAMQITELT